MTNYKQFHLSLATVAQDYFTIELYCLRWTTLNFFRYPSVYNLPALFTHKQFLSFTTEVC
jgi:hypothetical protein